MLLRCAAVAETGRQSADNRLLLWNEGAVVQAIRRLREQARLSPSLRRQVRTGLGSRCSSILAVLAAAARSLNSKAVD